MKVICQKIHICWQEDSDNDNNNDNDNSINNNNNSRRLNIQPWRQNINDIEN